MALVGLEAGTHVFFALLAMLAGATLFGYLMKKGVENGRVRQLAAIIAVLVWLSWITAAPIYMYEYGADKARIKAHPETVVAHGIGMEIKEHVFYTGLILATLIPIIAYGSDVGGNDAARRLLLGFRRQQKWLMLWEVVEMDARAVYGATIGFFISALFNSILVVVKESNESVHDWLAATFSHHWLGHGILTILVFLIFTGIGYSMSKETELDSGAANKLIGLVVAGVVLSSLIIAGYMTAHFFSE